MSVVLHATMIGGCSGHGGEGLGEEGLGCKVVAATAMSGSSSGSVEGSGVISLENQVQCLGALPVVVGGDNGHGEMCQSQSRKQSHLELYVVALVLYLKMLSVL